MGGFCKMPKRYARFLPSSENFILEDFPYYWITQVNNRYIQNIDDVLKKYGLDNSRRRILLALTAKPNASISELSEMIIAKMSTTTKIVYRLKDEGYVETFSCHDDARITRVLLTDKGKDMVIKINDLTTAALEQSFEGMTPLQIEKLIESLQMMFSNLSR